MAVRARTTGTSAANTSFAVSMPGGVQTGDRILVAFVNDNATNTASTASSGWSTLGTEDQGTGTNHRLTIFTKVATASNTLSVTTTESQEGCWVVVALQGDGGTPTLVFNDGAALTSGTVGAITGLASGNHDSVIFLALDNGSGGTAHVVTPPSGWGNLTTAGVTADPILGYSMDQVGAAVTGFTPADVTWTNAEQWITGHVVVPQVATAGGTVQVRSVASAANGNTPSTTVTKPTGTVQGDLLVAVATSDTDGSLAAMSGPAGWTQSGTGAGGSGAAFMRTWWKVATSSEPADYTFPDSDGAHSAAGILCLTGVDTSSPLAVGATYNVSATDATAHPAPSVAGVAGGLLVTAHLAATGGTARTYTPPTGMTEQVNITPSGGAPWVLLEVNTLPLAAGGATGTKDATCSGGEPFTCMSLVVAPASSEPVTKTGSDAATGADTGSVSATSTGGDTATGTDTGHIGLSGGDTATGSETGYVSEGKIGGDTGTGSESGTTTGTVTSGEATTGAESGSTSATLTPPAETATGSEGGHIAIPGEDTATGVDAHLPPTNVTVTFGDSATGSEGGHVETLFGNLIVNLYGIDPDTDALVPLPDYVQMSISRERNSRGAISVDYPINGQNFGLLRNTVTNDRDLEIEVWTNGTPTGAMRGYLQEASGDDVAEESIWSFTGGFLETLIDETFVYPQDPGPLIQDPDTGELVHTNPNRELIVNADNPGELVLLMVQQAQARGTLAGLDTDFSTTQDSNGTAWPGLVSARYSPGTSYTQILNNLVDLHLVEWAVIWDGTQPVLKLWAAEGRGADLTLGPRPVTLRRGRNLLDAPTSWSVRDSATTVLAAGQEGIYGEWSDPSALARRGRRIEKYATLNNAADDEAVLAFAQAELATIAVGVKSITHGIGLLPGEPRPIIAFDIGDWVYSQTGITTERLRVVQWEISIDADRQLSGTVALNDTIRDAIERLRERINAIQSGEAVVGTSEPGGGGVDRTPPAAPEGVVATSIAYQDPEHGPGQTLAMVTVGWLPVETNADGADSPLVQAAVFILDKIEDDIASPPEPDPEQEDGGPDYDPFDPATWTWKNCPQIVQDFAAPLRALWTDDGSPDTQTWLANFIAEMTQVPTAADDVAGYNVRYSYLGLEQVGGIPSSDPFPEEDRFYYEATPPSGTSSTSYSFGGVEGGARLRIEVRAFDRNGNFGAWTSISHDASNDTTPPPIPSGPVGFKAWFRTLDIPWDGFGSEGEVMPIDFSHVRVWVGQGEDMTLPAEPVGEPTQFDPLATAPQYVAQLFGAGTWNLPDVPLGVGWYARLQAVDYTGNASAGSAVVGPIFVEQLVSQDLIDDIITANLLGPDSVESAHIVNGAITTAKIVDAAIINAKIANLAVNDAKIETLSVGKLTTGTMVATVTVTGSLWTSTDTNATRLGFSSAGLQLYRSNSPSAGSTLIGYWRTSDGNMLVTGTFQSALSGQRIHIDPDGSFRIYPESGTNFSQIKNESGEMVWRGPLNGDMYSGRVNVNILGVGLNFSREKNLLGTITSEFVVLDGRTRMQAPFMNFVVDQSGANPAGGDRRAQFNTVNSSGSVITNSHVIYAYNSAGSGGAGWYGQNAGIKFELGQVLVTGDELDDFNIIKASQFLEQSSIEVKTDVVDARAALDPLGTIKRARSRMYRYTNSTTNDQAKFGVLAEELPEVLKRDSPSGVAVDLGSQIGVLWAAIGQMIDQEARTATGRALIPPGAYKSGDTVTVAIPWDDTPPEVPSSVTAMAIASMPTAIGKLRARYVPGTATLTGCQIRIEFLNTGPITVNNTLPIAVEAVGRYIFSPPYTTP